jgi:hypothetical protein
VGEEKAWDFLVQTHRHIVTSNLRHLTTMQQLLPQFEREGLKAVVLQGMALIGGVYEDIGLRPTGDIDLWVLPEQSGRITEIIQDFGYQQDARYPLIFQNQNAVIDVSTHLMWAGRIRTRKWLIAVDQRKIFQRCIWMDVEGLQLRCLAPADQAMYLSLHALKHNFGRLIWLVDILRLVGNWGKDDWRKLTRRAEEWGQARALTAVMVLMQRLLGFDPPSELKPFLRRYRPSRIENTLLERKSKEGMLPNWASWLLLRPRKPGYLFFPYLLENLFPRPAVLREVFDAIDETSNFHLYARRISQLLKQLAATF